MVYGTVANGLLLPLWGTTLGAALVLFMKRELRQSVQKALTGFAAGVMLAATVWSLLIPAIEQSERLGRLAALPAILGICCGVGALLALDRFMPLAQTVVTFSKRIPSQTRTTVLAIVLHNIPEGMAVGVVYAAWLTGQPGVTRAVALSLVLGIAIQNFPEGAIVSMPLHGGGVTKGKAFACGAASGLVEPAAGLVTVLAARFIAAVLPYLLGFSAGAMIYAVLMELVPEMTAGAHARLAAVWFTAGFILMMFLDVALG